MLDLAARLALCGSVRILDAGNQCNVYPIAQRLRGATHDLNAALRRIQIQRAFTCYQVATLLGGAKPGPTATLVLDFLATFYDQDVKLPEATRLLRDCLGHLQRLAEGAPVLISARLPPAACAERQPLLELLREAAAQCWEIEEEQPSPAPLCLFYDESSDPPGSSLAARVARLPQRGTLHPTGYRVVQASRPDIVERAALCALCVLQATLCVLRVTIKAQRVAFKGRPPGAGTLHPTGYRVMQVPGPDILMQVLTREGGILRPSPNVRRFNGAQPTIPRPRPPKSGQKGKKFTPLGGGMPPPKAKKGTSPPRDCPLAEGALRAASRDRGDSETAYPIREEDELDPRDGE